MPLLHRRPFVPSQPPKKLNLDDEVFFCPLTKEVFTNYEQFFERTILCNSLVWSCSYTERGNMTYQEALDYEAVARKKLMRFPKDLQKPMLLLVKSMSYSRIEELNDTIFSFIKKRYFIGEQLEVRVKTSKYEECRVLDVFPNKPLSETAVNGHANGELSSEDEEDDDKPLSKFVKAKHLEPNEVTYQVKILGSSFNPIRTVPWTALRRKVRREQCKIFLKQACAQDPFNKRTYFVKREIAQKLGLDGAKWEDVFAGPNPAFADRSPKSRKTTEKTNAKFAEKKVVTAAKEDARQKQKGKAQEEMMFLEMKKQEKEARLEIKKKEAEEAKRQRQILMEQRKKDYREQIEKKREAKRKMAEFQKQWNKQRDDLECDDLKEIPQPREIKTRIPPHLFGDVLYLLEFFHTFETLFDAKDEFPRGVSLGQLEKAIMDENQDGPLCDFLFFFLSNLFRTHREEEGENCYVVESGDLALSEKAKEDPSLENLMSWATLCATWAEKYQGCSLDKLDLDSYTVSEILRLYLLTSAARAPSDSRLWRFQQRGGYTVSDDAALRLCLDRPELVQKLATTSIFNFSPDEKIEILSCLSNHLLSFVTPRDFLDDMSEKYWAALLDYRMDKRSERKRERDFLVDRMKLKLGQVRVQNLNESGRENASPGDKKDNGMEGKSGKVVELLSSEKRLEQLKAMDEEEKVAKEAWEFRQEKHLNDIAQFKQFKVLPLGHDRSFRRYWALNCMPGLLVEEYPDEYLTDDLLKVKVQQRRPSQLQAMAIDSGGDFAATGQQSESAPINGTADSLSSPPKANGLSSENNASNNSSPTPATAGSSLKLGFPTGTQGKTYKWYIYSEPDEIEGLLNALNRRGFRESKLCDSLHHAMKKIVSQLKKCPIGDLCQTPKKEDLKAKSEASRIAIELSLRDQILDLETRIFEGTLGGIKEEEGIEWVQRVTNGGTYDDELRNKLVCSVLNNGVAKKMETEDGDVDEEEAEQQQKISKKDKLVAPPVVRFPIEVKEAKVVEECSDEKMEEDIAEAASLRNRSEVEKVQVLALALLQIERGIDRRYLKAPLGYSVDISRRRTRSKGPTDDSEEEIARRKKESAPYLRRWEHSLINCTSASQVCLHLTTLNKCIIWARSVLNASCRICHRRGDADKMLLCDLCDRGHHMYCLKPALKAVPIGDWFCPQCKPIHSNRISPRKVRTTSYVEEASSEEEDDTEADETEEEDPDDEEEEDAEEEDEEEKDSYEEDESSEEEEEQEPSPPKRGIKYKFPTRPTRTSGRERKTKNTSPAGPSGSRTRGRATGRSQESSGRNTESNSKRGRSTSERRRAMKRNALNDDDDYFQSASTSSSSRRRSTGVWKELNTCQEVLKELIQHKDGWPFVLPVSKKQVPDYYDIITNPMDFSTMQKKLKNVEYADPTEFVSDMKLVFSNCLRYNQPRSVHAKAAMQLGNFFEKRMKETGLDRYKDLPPNPPSKKRKA